MDSITIKKAILLFGVCHFVAALVLLCGCSGEPALNDVPQDTSPILTKLPEPNPEYSDTEKVIFETNLSEDMILDLSPGLKLLLEKFEGGTPDLNSVFADSIAYIGPKQIDLSQAIANPPASGIKNVTQFDCPIESESSTLAPDAIWTDLIGSGKFADSQMGVVEGVVDRNANVLRMTTVFEGRLLHPGEEVVGVKATQELDWTPVGNDEWRVTAWRQRDLKISFAALPMFRDETSTLVPDVELHAKVDGATHEQRMIEQFQSGVPSPVADPQHPLFNDWESSFQYPASSVVDFDGDGWDDLFLMDRYGGATLLRNVKNEEGVNLQRKFVDVTAESGLAIKGFANCALFADFDNDGDPDVVVGRSAEPSLFFRNDAGKFMPDESVNESLADVKFVVAGAVADINRDGLLDVYLSTYCFLGAAPETWLPDVVRPEDVLKLSLMIENNNPFLDRPGPPNIVLMNRGGKLERGETDDTLKQWRSSYQPLWYDVDRDGDCDLYVCNDFSADVFLRNDTEQGSMSPKFTDITSEVFPGGNMGFGMGVGTGDYNKDGQLDLYVSNMYSKAGLRIVKQLGGDVDPKISVAAKGNFLYENRDGKFYQVAGLNEEAQHVSKVGWSFGGQFADFNNDANLDLYVPSGFFTAPKMLASSVDL